jgi:fructose-1-phosphate kinase PfkB-like protein
MLDETDTIINAQGCGDSMVAGLVDALIQGMSPEAALSNMVAAATANLLVNGAGCFGPELFAKIKHQVVVTQLPRY